MPVKLSKPKYATLADTVEQRINDGSYPPGATIPSEAALMAEFGMARPTVVRALNILVAAGLLEPHAGMGRVVRSADQRGHHNLGVLADQLRAAGWIVIAPGDRGSDMLDRLSDAMFVASTGGCDHSARTCGDCLAAAALRVFTRLELHPPENPLV
jgi:DNA-binding transcriptional regulator YhcF (GntR family)